MRTDGQQYYKVLVSVKMETDRGKIKRIREEYLTLATGVTEAEANIVENFTEAGDIREYSVKAVAATKILEVV